MEKTEISRFIARQKEKWTQADVESMTLEQFKMIHMVKLIPDRKLKKECAEILTKKDSKLEDIEKRWQFSRAQRTWRLE